MTNAWIEHIRQYAKDNNLTYACAIPYAKATYTKKDGTKSTPSKSLPPSKPEPKATPEPQPVEQPEQKEDNNHLRFFMMCWQRVLIQIVKLMNL